MGLSFLDLSLMTIKDVGGNWVRSTLTTFGIFMGVAAVNATLNIQAINNTILQQALAEQDNPNVTIRLTPPGAFESAELTPSDIAALKREVTGIGEIASYGIVFADAQYEGQDLKPNVFSVSENYLSVTGRKILAGRFFEPSDYTKYRPAALVDSIIAQQYFKQANPVGQAVFLNGTRFTVIGEMESKSNIFSSGDKTPQGEIWITETYEKVISRSFSLGSNPVIAINSLRNYQKIQDQIKSVLENRYPNYDVSLLGNVEDLYKKQKQQQQSNQILQAVALLALIIAGVGIANITAASVIERTREIGLRRALGATDWEVISQFIAEATLLSVAGGLTAVAVVHFSTKAASDQIFKVPYHFYPQVALMSMGAAFGIGVGSSLIPALRVTRIDVVQALRGE